MEEGGYDFSERDRLAARNFQEAADRSSLRRIVYLGGLGPGGAMSRHLSSRHEVGSILAGGQTPVTELRAAVIIGSGSVSFEMLRYLTEVLPVMVTPSWVRTRCQPIAVSDVLDILIAAMGAEAAGLPRRWIIPVPVLTPRLSSHWVGLVTPLPTSVAKPLVESLRVEVTVGDNSYAEGASGRLIPYREAVERALSRSEEHAIATRWSDASLNPAQAMPGDPEWAGGTVLTDEQIVDSTASREDLYSAFARIGGKTGYYTMTWAWTIRGLIDSIVGGAGLRRGRRHPEQIQSGEALDFWRVVHADYGRMLELYAEMKLPGEAWLVFEATEAANGSRLTQRAVFIPRGLLGRLYWWAMLPFHLLIFRRMARRIATAAESGPTTAYAQRRNSL